MIKRFAGAKILIILAAIAIALIVSRACLQSVTIDEANTGLDFVAGPAGIQWYPSSGNHVFYSILDRLATAIFGFNELTLRMPAILGALVYISSALCFCLIVTPRMLLRLPLFLCLVYNPMVLDYLVAARGYGLAIGFLFAALTLLMPAVLSSETGQTFSLQAGLASVFLAISFASNFSFAYVDALTIVFFFYWFITSRQRGQRQYLRTAFYCFVPGIIAAIVLCGPTVWNFPRSQLYFGSQSLSEMWQSIVGPSFDDLNPNVVNSSLLLLLNKVRSRLPLLNVIAMAAALIAVELSRLRSRKPVAQSVALIHVLASITVATFLAHYLVFRILHIPLPKGRTGLYFVVLWFMILGVSVSARESPRRDVVRYLGIAVLMLSAAYFAGSLRLGYFKEWTFDADSKQLYWIVKNLHQRCGFTSFGIDWRYSSALDFYRMAYHDQSLPNFDAEESGKIPLGRQAYALFYPTSEDFIKQEHLQVLYHNEFSDAAIAIRACHGF